MRLKNSGFLMRPKDMRNLHRNAKESSSRIFGMSPGSTSLEHFQAKWIPVRVT